MLVRFATVTAACALAWVYRGKQFSLIIYILYIITYHWRWIHVAIRTFPRDMKALFCYMKVLSLTRRLSKRNLSMPDILHEVVIRHPEKACFLLQNETWTFQQVEDFSLRTSAALRAQGIKCGDVVAVMMNNCPELPATWVGTARLGGVSPLINTNQTGNALLHSINVAKCKVIIYGSEFHQAFEDIKKELDPTMKLFRYNRRRLNTTFDGKLKIQSKEVENSYDWTFILENTPLPKWTPSVGGGFNGKLLYIYTSGTTGLPKAAVISTSRMVFMASGMHYMGGLNTNDIIYCPMPLYHSAGGCMTVGLAFIFGCTVVLRPQFSASAFFPDCIKYNATVAQYIGEMCRYVLATPPSPTDKQHRVHTVYGNGMRPVIWKEFVKRFNIKRVAEFYGATEGNANIMNVDNKIGAIGFISRIFSNNVYPIAILKIDETTGEPIRNNKGLCVQAQANEPGVFVGKIVPNNPSRAFLGYVDQAASDKKIIKDVFKKGDQAFISGDILISDELGYLYFRDRTGDTFRWRGENVSTTEVEAAVSKVADQRDAVVYGVEIPNIEGRAGMCGIVDTDGTLDLDKLAKDISRDLPKYARPVFIRIMASINMTGTFKLQKIDLQKEGYNPTVVKDKLYYLDSKLDKYLPLDTAMFDKIGKGLSKL